MQYLQDVASGVIDINDNAVQLPSDEDIKFSTMQKSAQKGIEFNQNMLKLDQSLINSMNLTRTYKLYIRL